MTLAQAGAALQAWESEGGAAAVPAAAAPPLASGDAALLARLGAALVDEWNNLPMPLQRAVYDRAVAVGGSPGTGAAKETMARFLHDHKRRADLK